MVDFDLFANLMHWCSVSCARVCNVPVLCVLTLTRISLLASGELEGTIRLDLTHDLCGKAQATRKDARDHTS